MKRFFSEFRAFIARGNVMDMAVGVIVGGAFSAIVNSFIGDILMPVLGIFLGGVDFSSWVISLPNLFGGEAIPMNIGAFLNSVVSFLVLALGVFVMVRAINRMKKKEEAAPAPAKPDPQVELLTEIRDLLKK